MPRRTPFVAILTVVLVLPLLVSATDEGRTADSEEVTLSEFTVAPETMEAIRGKWLDRVLSEHEPGTWAPLRYDLDDEDLAALNLPPADELRQMRFDRPTMVDRDGRTSVVSLPAAPPPDRDCNGERCDDDGDGNGNGNGDGKGNGDGNDDGDTASDETVTTVAGAGWFGIRPGAMLLLITENSIGWCSAGHVYGSAGSYQLSTAGHCGSVGDRATVIAAIGDNDDLVAPILLDIGTFKTVRDNGVGDDWALIDIFDHNQDLVTPTAVFWGGPRGMYGSVGAVVDVNFRGNNPIPEVTVDPDPTLAQGVHHYGHGIGVGGPGGTPRVGTAIWWGEEHYMFEGAISPGDSGSYANTTTGDAVGDTMEAAGINTHLYVDPLMREGVGFLAGTRATEVSATLADGQIVSYPVPADGLP